MKIDLPEHYLQQWKNKEGKYFLPNHTEGILGWTEEKLEGYNGILNDQVGHILTALRYDLPVTKEGLNIILMMAQKVACNNRVKHPEGDEWEAIFSKLGWTIMKTPEKMRFVTTDYPLLCLPTQLTADSFFYSPHHLKNGVKVCFPLTPRHMLLSVVGQSARTLPYMFQELSADQVMGINTEMAKLAQECIISIERDRKVLWSLEESKQLGNPPLLNDE